MKIIDGDSYHATKQTQQQTWGWEWSRERDEIIEMNFEWRIGGSEPAMGGI